MKRTYLLPVTVFLAGLAAHASYAVSLSPLPMLDPAGAGNLNPSILGMPIDGPVSIWPIPLLDWSQTGEVAIEIAVIDDASGPSVPRSYAVFLNVQNNTPDTWSDFEFEIDGPGAFSLTSPTELGITSILPTELTLSDITYTGLDWDQASFGPRTFSFGVDVTAPIANEPLRLTLRPVQVPEPTTGASIAIGLLVINRRPRRA